MKRRPITQADCDRLKLLRGMGHGFTACGRLMKRWPELLRKVEARGYTPTPLKDYPRPADFSAMAARMTLDELKRHYRVRWEVVKRWSQEVARKPMPVGRAKPDFMRPCPPDFVEQNAKLSWAKLLKHYSAGPSTIYRWRDECGVKAPRPPIGGRRRAQPATARPWVETYTPAPEYAAIAAQLEARDRARIAA